MDISKKTTNLGVGEEKDQVVQFLHLISRFVFFLISAGGSPRFMRNKFRLVNRFRNC
jgi:hypothetical protein